MMRAALLAALLSPAWACTNILVTKGASADGNNMIAYSADAEELYGHLRHYAPGKVGPNDKFSVYDWDSGVYTGDIPQPCDERGYVYNVVGNMNEHGLAIGETTFGGRDLANPEGIIDYGSMIWTTLQSTRTARDAVHRLYNLTVEWGYRSEGETFSIADRDEVWVMDLIGKGQGKKGSVFVARKLPDGYICSHANQARITTWDQTDTENNIWAPDTISFARENGWFSGSDEDFSFSDIYDPVTFSGCRFCELRAWSVFNSVAEDRGFGARYLDYVQGANLTNRMPLFVKPAAKLSVNDTLWLLRTHYDNTYFDQRPWVTAGPYGAVQRPRPLTWEYEGSTYFNERPVGTQQTGWNFVAHSRTDLPQAVGPVIWFGADDTSTGPKVPCYASSRATSDKWAAESPASNMTQFNMHTAHWAYNLVANYAYTRWHLIGPHVQRKIVDVEAAFAADLARTDKLAAALAGAGDPEGALKLMTSATVSRLDQMVDDWVAFYGETFARFMDYGIIEYEVPAKPDDHVLPKVTEVGFMDSFKQRIIDETGDKYAMPEEGLTQQDVYKMSLLRRKL